MLAVFICLFVSKCLQICSQVSRWQTGGAHLKFVALSVDIQNKTVKVLPGHVRNADMLPALEQLVQERIFLAAQ